MNINENLKEYTQGTGNTQLFILLMLYQIQVNKIAKSVLFMSTSLFVALTVAIGWWRKEFVGYFHRVLSGLY